MAQEFPGKDGALSTSVGVYVGRRDGVWKQQSVHGGDMGTFSSPLQPVVAAVRLMDCFERSAVSFSFNLRICRHKLEEKHEEKFSPGNAFLWW